MPQGRELMIQLRRAHGPLRQKSSTSIPETTFAMTAIPPEFFSEILEQVAHNATRVFRQLGYLAHPIDIVSFSHLETLRKPSS